MGKEFGNITEGDNKTGISGMSAVVVVTRQEIERISKHNKITYARLVVEFFPQKSDPNCV